MSVWLGSREVRIMHIGRGHTAGDVIAYVPDSNVVFSGDLVEYHSACYCGDAHFTDWPATLDALAAFAPAAMVPGRGAALTNRGMVADGIKGTRAFLTDLYEAVKGHVAAGRSLRETFERVHETLKPSYGDWVIFEHCLPFNVTRAYDEAGGLDHPRIWTDESVPAWYRQNAILYLRPDIGETLDLVPTEPVLLDKVHPAFWARANRELRYANALPESEVLRQQAQQQQ